MAGELTYSEPINELGESIKLVKNSKGYTYELRVRCEGKEKIDDKFIARLKKLNQMMIDQFNVSDIPA